MSDGGRERGPLDFDHDDEWCGHDNARYDNEPYAE